MLLTSRQKKPTRRVRRSRVTWSLLDQMIVGVMKKAPKRAVKRMKNIRRPRFQHRDPHLRLLNRIPHITMHIALSTSIPLERKAARRRLHNDNVQCR
jgi:hypothetical protein